MTANTSGDGVRRWHVFPPDVDEVVRASDYDAALSRIAELESKLAQAKETNDNGVCELTEAMARIAALAAKLRQMVMHGDRCNWFTDEDERNVVAAARALLSPNEAK